MLNELVSFVGLNWKFAAVRSAIPWALDAIDAKPAPVIQWGATEATPATAERTIAPELAEAIKELGQWAEGGYPTPDYLTGNHSAYQLGLGKYIARRIVGITEVAQ
jgi:hypothetical protein